MTKWTIMLTVLLLSVSPLLAETDASNIPPKPLESLQTILGRTTELLWEKSDEFFHAGNYERSIATLKLITELDPTDVEAYSVAAWLMASKDRPSDAEAFLKLGLSRNPYRSDLYEELGRFYFNELKDYATAAKYLEQAIRFPDCPAITWHSLAHAYEKSGNLQKSVETWEHALTLEPNDPVVLNNLKRVKDKLAEQTKAEE